MKVSSRRRRSSRRAEEDGREGRGREAKVNRELHLFPFLLRVKRRQKDSLWRKGLTFKRVGEHDLSERRSGRGVEGGLSGTAGSKGQFMKGRRNDVAEPLVSLAASLSSLSQDSLFGEGFCFELSRMWFEVELRAEIDLVVRR